MPLTEQEIATFKAAWLAIFKERLTEEKAALNAKQLMQVYALLAKYE